MWSDGLIDWTCIPLIEVTSISSDKKETAQTPRSGESDLKKTG